MLDNVKAIVVENIPAGQVRDIVEQKWDKLMSHLIIVPIQFIHLLNILNNTDIGKMNFFAKMFFFLRLVFALAVYEGLRILLSKMATGAISTHDVMVCCQEISAEVKGIANMAMQRATEHINTTSLAQAAEQLTQGAQAVRNIDPASLAQAAQRLVPAFLAQGGQTAAAAAHNSPEPQARTQNSSESSTE